MKPSTLLKYLGTIGVAIAAVASANAAPMGSAFTYQGRLNFGGAPAADGLYDFRFTLHDAATLGSPIGSAVSASALPVTNGLFTTQLDFGAPAFTSGEARWLQLEVNTNGVMPLAALNPRQRLAPTPQAIYAGNAATASAVAPGAVTSAGLAPASVDGSAISDGSIGAADLGPVLLNGTFWKLGGNAGTTPGVNFLGTTDNQPLELRVNNQGALRLVEDAEGTVNVLVGPGFNSIFSNVTSAGVLAGALNRIRTNSSGSVIAGGEFNVISNAGSSTIAGGSGNIISNAPGGTISGGIGNIASGFVATVGGGAGNSALSDRATVAGGTQNQAAGDQTFIGGGSGNTAANLRSTIVAGNRNFNIGPNGFIGGGQSNTLGGNAATLGGGELNRILGLGSYATIPGGRENTAAAGYTFAAGRRASAVHTGTFVWADSTDAEFISTTDNQFNVRASGGARFETSGAGMTLDGQPVLAGTVGTGQLGLGAVTSEKIADGSIGAADLSPSLLNGTFWKLGGNTGAGNFLGTADNQPLEFRVNGVRALRIEPSASDSPNVIGGSPVNSADPGIKGATVAGGGTINFLGLPSANQVSADFATIGGGSGNRIRPGAAHAFVGSGLGNFVQTNAYLSVIAGGQGNNPGNAYGVIGGGVGSTNTGFAATIAGGFFNTATTNGATVGGGGVNAALGVNSTVVGGYLNTVAAEFAFIGGGQNNTNIGAYSVLGGGYYNILKGDYATIGGGRSNSIPDNGSTIGGGIENSTAFGYVTIGGGYQNVAMAPFGVIGGGSGNIINSSGPLAFNLGGTIGGGLTNRILGGSSDTISGGINNTIDVLGGASAVGGGNQNSVKANTSVSSIAGGFHNQVGTGVGFITGGAIGGGTSNTVGASYATVPGGVENEANAQFSLAAGRRAKAEHSGSFVWADSTNADFSSTAANQFAVRANNGVMIQSSTTALDLRGGGGIRVAGAGLNTSTPIFTHRGNAFNTTGPETRISHPHCDGKPGAILIVTYNFNPAGTAGTRNDRPVGIYYTGTQWAIYNLDGTAMPLGAAYNVLVANP